MRKPSGVNQIFRNTAVALLLLLLVPYGHTQRVAASEEGSISVMGAAAVENVQPVLDEFYNQTAITAVYTQEGSLSDYLLNCQTAGNCPDVAIIPNIGIMKHLAEKNEILPLETILPDFEPYYADTWRILGSVNGVLVGLPLNATSKSMVWYLPPSLVSVSATPPANWSELLSLADAFVADGQTPFSIGAESGAASGWPLTDIFENILARVAGADTHRMLVDHTLSWTDPKVVLAMQRMTDIIGQDAYIDGGIAAIPITFFMDAFFRVFRVPSYANMHFGATFMVNWFDPSMVPITDYDFFTFPEIDPTYGTPMIGGGDFVILFNDTSDTRSLMQFLASPAGGEVWIAANPGVVSPNSGVDLDLYTNPITRNLADDILNSEEFLFDLDDQLPSELQVYLWGALLDFVENQENIEVILQGIQDKADETQGFMYATYLPAISR